MYYFTVAHTSLFTLKHLEELDVSHNILKWLSPDIQQLWYVLQWLLCYIQHLPLQSAAEVKH